jgi:hypothetical protein
MRPLIQYDLDDPPTYTEPFANRHPDTRRSPTKKRKRHHHAPKHASGLPQKPLQHWDDPGSAAVGMVYDDQEGGAATSAPLPVTAASCADEEDDEGDYDYDYDHGEEDVEGEEEEEESRALTHQEIWDDAALVDAWNAAEAEYEVPCPSFLRRRSRPSRPTMARRKPGKQNL